MFGTPYIFPSDPKNDERLPSSALVELTAWPQDQPRAWPSSPWPWPPPEANPQSLADASAPAAQFAQPVPPLPPEAVMAAPSSEGKLSRDDEDPAILLRCGSCGTPFDCGLRACRCSSTLRAARVPVRPGGLGLMLECYSAFQRRLPSEFVLPDHSAPHAEDARRMIGARSSVNGVHKCRVCSPWTQGEQDCSSSPGLGPRPSTGCNRSHGTNSPAEDRGGVVARCRYINIKIACNWSIGRRALVPGKIE